MKEGTENEDIILMEGSRNGDACDGVSRDRGDSMRTYPH